MTGPEPIVSDDTRDAEQKAGFVLKIGVWSSAALMIAGLVLAALRSLRIDVPAVTPTIPQIVERIFSLSLDPVTFMFSGLLVLMCTPVLRVLAAVVGFAEEKDRRFVVVSLVVFFMLAGEVAYSLLLK